MQKTQLIIKYKLTPGLYYKYRSSDLQAAKEICIITHFITQLKKTLSD